MNKFVIGACAIFMCVFTIIVIASNSHDEPITKRIDEVCASDRIPQDCRLREAARVIDARERNQRADEDRQIGG